MRKKRVYVESSVISYLTARLSTDILKLAKQTQTRMWWERRGEWELFVSPTVMQEVQGGDREAAQKRAEIAHGLSLLPDSEEIVALAGNLVADGLLPGKASVDAVHIASAAVHGMDYLITWNQKHIFNLDRIESLYAAIRRRGYVPPTLARPDFLLEAPHGSQRISF